MEFYIILPRAKIWNLIASAKNVLWSRICKTIKKIKIKHILLNALQIINYEDNPTIILWKFSKLWTSKLKLDSFHKSFHNPTKIFREHCSHARAVFHVFVSLGWVPMLGPKVGSGGWVLGLGHKGMSKEGLPRFGPMIGSHSWVLRLDHKVVL